MQWTPDDAPPAGLLHVSWEALLRTSCAWLGAPPQPRPMQPLVLLRLALRRVAVRPLHATATAAVRTLRFCFAGADAGSVCSQRWRAELLFSAYVICCSYVLSLLDTHLYPLR